MRLIVFILLVAFMMAGPSAGQERTDEGRRGVRTWTDPDLGHALVEGVATAEALWIRGSSGKVVRLDRQTGERMIVAEGAVDILPDGLHLWVLVTLNPNDHFVSDLRQPELAPRRVHFDGSAIALFATEAGAGVLTDTTALLPAPNGWSRVRLAGRLDPYAHVSAWTNDALFVGYDKGEWGGGLRRVDLPAGAVSIVREDADGLCKGRLNPECSPVVGIVSDPERADCVLVGASLSHMSSRLGEVLRVCGASIEPVFSDPLPVVPDGFTLPGQTWPFDSLVAARDGWIAVGQDRFARSRRGVVSVADVPPLRAWAGLQVSDPVDEVIFVEAACCWGSTNFIQYRVIALPMVD